MADAAGAAITQHNLNQLLAVAAPPKQEPKPIEPGKPIGTVKPVPPAVGLSSLSKLFIVLVTLGVIAGSVLISGEILVGPTACDRPVPISREGAALMNRQIEAAKAMQPGQRQTLEFTEEMFNSYVNVISARSGDLIDGGARLTEPGVALLCGGLPQAGGLPVAVKVRVRVDAGPPYEIAGVAMRVLNTGGGFGWVAVPDAVAGQFGLIDRVREALGDSYIVTALRAPTPTTWIMAVQGK